MRTLVWAVEAPSCLDSSYDSDRGDSWVGILLWYWLGISGGQFLEAARVLVWVGRDFNLLFMKQLCIDKGAPEESTSSLAACFHARTFLLLTLTSGVPYRIN
jgi:hypothetical protein